jgi:hypothetical protein
MQLTGFQFQVIDWNQLAATTHPGAPGVATWRTITAGATRVRMKLIAHEMAHVAENQRGVVATSAKVSHPDDHHVRRADQFATAFGRREARFETTDRATLVEHLRAEGRRRHLPFIAELESHLGSPLHLIDGYVGEAARVAQGLMAAGAVAVGGGIGLADRSPQRDDLMAELDRMIAAGDRALAEPARPAPGTAGASVDRGTIHRANDDAKKPDKSKDAIKQRVTEWAADVKVPDSPKKGDVKWGAIKNGRTQARYYQAPDSAISTVTYAAGKTGRDKDDLAAAFAERYAKEIRLHRVSPGNYIVSKSDAADDYVGDVVHLKPISTWKG